MKINSDIQRLISQVEQSGPLTLERLENCPKIQLHLHLDTSVSLDLLPKLAQNLSIPVNGDYRKRVVAPAKCKDLPDYLSYVTPIVDLLQSEENLDLATRDVIRQLKTDHIYAELRFAPQLHLQHGLNIQQVVETVHRAIRDETAGHALEIRTIACLIGEIDDGLNQQLVDYLLSGQSWFSAVDLAGNEQVRSGTIVDWISKLHDHGYPVTIHAGEFGSADSIEVAIHKLKASRIGHGVRLIENNRLKEEIKEKGITLEMCPTSNVQTNATRILESHPIDQFFKDGVPVTVNCDAMTVTPTTMTREYGLLILTFNWGWPEFIISQLAAIDAAFISSEKKTTLHHHFRHQIMKTGQMIG